MLTALFLMVAAPPISVEVRLDPKLAPAKAGRVVVGFAKKGETPDFTGYKPPVLPILGADAAKFPVVLDAAAECFPRDGLHNLPPGEYAVQAILMTNPDINLPDAPGNLYGEPVNVKLGDGPITLTLDRVRKQNIPKDTATHKYLSIPSKLLSDFHGRPVSYRVGVVLPKNHANETAAYALLVDIGGFGTRYTDAAKLEPDPRFIQIVPDGAGPLGDPYQVNSANNGPYGDALVKEVIPFIEKTYRGIGTAKSRFTCGISTGGWVSLALQVFYPDFFNGCWSQCPDSVTFERFELVDLYSEANAFVNRFGNERPSTRTIDGDVISTLRHEVLLERVLGRGGKWELSGRDWASWNAVYGPRGKDGRPVPIWDGKTGSIDTSVLEHWKKYDLKHVLEANWKTLGPKLAGGKVNIWVGESDDYYLNAAVHRLKAAAATWKNPPFDGRILIELRKNHDYGGWTRKDMLSAMAKRAAQ
ncbi:MAG: alpha/beta hydrolase-fold protein [Gemmataceae bacterium]